MGSGHPPPFQISKYATAAQPVMILSPIHTADADATQLSRCVASASAVCIGF